MTGATISHYKVLDKIGEGGVGVVYKAEDLHLRRTVALKFLSENALANRQDRERFQREAQAAAALDHPNICTVYGIEEADGQVFIVMAYVDGPSLSKLVKSGPLSLEQALDIGAQIAQGLQEAHESKIVHRDIKSANILLSSKRQVKIGDFGIALLTDRSRITQSGTSLGTVAYMSPEQALGKRADRRSDIWSLGVVLFEMVAGRLPFGGKHEHVITYSLLNEEPNPLGTARPNLPAGLERIVSKALRKEPEERYQHVDDMLVDLRAVQKSLESKSQAAERS